MDPLCINMLYMKSQPSGQGVASATREQIRLLKETTSGSFIIRENARKDGDINHYHQIAFGFYLRLLASRFKKQKPVTVMHIHFLPDTLEGSIKLPRPFMKIFCKYVLDFYRRADHAVVVNPVFKKALADYGMDPERIHYIPNYVSKEYFYPQSPAEKSESRRKYGFGDEDFIVLGVGQVQSRKGVLDFLEAAKACPEMKFIWAGGFSFGAITDGYRGLKERVENPPENVVFPGIVEREALNAIYNMADVLFLPSYNELFPMSILEACNTGLPLLLRDLDLYEDILFSDYRKGHALADFIRELKALKNDEALRKKASQDAFEISQYYSKEHVSEIWQHFYREIYAQSKK